MPIKKPKKKAKGVTMDFSETLNIWSPVKAVEVVLEIISAAEHDTEDSLLVVNYKVASGKYEGKETRDNLPYAGKGAFRLRNLLEALGMEIPDEAAELDFDDLVGQEVGAVVTPYDWEGKSKVKFDYCSVEDLNTDEDEVPAKKSKKPKPEAEEDEEEATPAKKKKKPAKPDPEEEEEEEEPAPKKGAKKTSKKAKVTQEEIRDMDDEELQSLIDKHEIELDLSDFKTLKKQQAAVIDACEEAGILSEE